MYTAALATKSSELEQIAALSRQNLKLHLSEDEKRSQGFITWEYSFAKLEQMNRIAPAVIVTWEEEIVGYALTALKETAALRPELNDMIAHLETLSFNNRALNTYRYYIMGQICVAKPHRGKGIVEKLYRHHKTIFSPRFELLATEVSTSNHRSIQAHKKTGFQTIDTYRDSLDEWDVVVWDWKNNECRISNTK